MTSSGQLSSGGVTSGRFSICSNAKRFGTLPVPIMLKLFDSKIVPIVTYGAEIWGLTDIDEAERTADNFYRRILGLRKNAPSTFVRGELGRRSLFHNICSN